MSKVLSTKKLTQTVFTESLKCLGLDTLDLAHPAYCPSNKILKVVPLFTSELFTNSLPS